MSDDTHGCPGDCGTRVPGSQLACKQGWLRLPLALRKAVNAAYLTRGRNPAAHYAAVAAAMRWYREHPIGGDS